MKIGEMLGELKKEGADLKRLTELRRETFWVENKCKPAVSTAELTGRIRKKAESIRKRKLAIQENNLRTEVGGLRLAEAILKISDLRDEISGLNELRNGDNDHFRFRDEKEKKIAQLNPLQLEELIGQLEAEKAKLDSRIQSVNWKEELRKA
ncbi:MAG: hypothetical protein ABH854_00935 [Candidatus Diapherotrites archaeon]|nr:hypothetical protein [Candidatus Micrarchaeota archaeon]